MSNRGNNYSDNQMWILKWKEEHRDIVSGAVEQSKIVDEAVTVIVSVVQLFMMDDTDVGCYDILSDTTHQLPLDFSFCIRRLSIVRQIKAKMLLHK